MKIENFYRGDNESEKLLGIRFDCKLIFDEHISDLCKKNPNFTAPFYGWGSTGSRLQPLRGGSLLFTIQFPEIPGTHFIDLGRMKSWVDLGAT